MNMDFILVKGGCYEMGCYEKESNCDKDETPAHTVCVKDFYMGKYEVTVRQWKQFISDSGFKGDAKVNAAFLRQFFNFFRFPLR